MERNNKSSKVKPYPVYIPHNIDLDALLIRYPIDVPNAKDKLSYLLHLIHNVPAFFKKDEDDNNNEYTILYSKYLEDIVDEYTALFHWLVERDVVQRNDSYLSGARSKGYRFTDEYCTKLKKVYIKKITLINKLKRSKNKRLKEVDLYPEHLIDVTDDELNGQLSYSEIAKQRLSHLNRCLSDIEIDIRAAMLYLEITLEEDKRNLSPRKAMNRYIRAKLIVDAFVNVENRFGIDSTSGRLHTLLTILNSPLRACLSYNGISLMSIDLKNSQPVLSLTLLDEVLFFKNKMADRIAIYNKKLVMLSGTRDNISDFYIMFGDLLQKNSQKADTLKYKELVISGTLYKYFAQLLQELKLIDPELNTQHARTLAKKALLKCMFNTNQAIGYDHIQKAFQVEFPSVYETFQFIKTSEHRTLACVLQNLEAEIFLHQACREIARINPDIPLFTIHDSIASTPDNIPLVKEVLSKCLYQALGIIPILAEEHWDAAYLENEKKKKTVLKITANDDNEDSGYGYVDPEVFFIPNYSSVTRFTEEHGLRKNYFMKGLRQLEIIDTLNRPIPAYENAKLLFTYSRIKKTRLGRSLEFPVTKISPDGCKFLEKVIIEHPELFPKKKARKKKK